MFSFESILEIVIFIIVPLFQRLPKTIIIRNVAYVGDHIVCSQLSGWDITKNPRLNRGLAFTHEERMRLGIHGLLPAAERTQDQQVLIHMALLRRYKNNLNKYMFLMGLRERNEKLFFRMVQENVEELMPIVYTPTVGLACQSYGLTYRIGNSLFITKYDKGHVLDVVNNWPENNIKAVCMTDGERILGLGDLGAFGMGIPVGKLALYTGLGGVRPHQLLPITIDIGTNTEALWTDATYIGIREKRLQGDEYVDFVDEVLRALVERYGCNCLIQFEDFSNVNAFFFLEKYKTKYCTFNDDIQGTASVIVAGILCSERITGIPIENHKSILFFGAGGANLGIAGLLCKKMEYSGVSLEESRRRIWMMDVDGLLTTDRPNLDSHRSPYAKKHAPTKDLAAVVKEIKPSILIGASTAAASFTPEILKSMAEFNKMPVIFALSNPTSKSECTAQEAYDHTEGRVVFASGSPFPPVNHGGKTYKTGQGNNAYIFPGVALAVIVSGIHFVTDDMFLIAAQCVADLVSEDDLAIRRIYPDLSTLPDVSVEIATRITEYAYCKGLASHFPEPTDVREFIRKYLYTTKYTDVSLHPYDWPKFDTSHLKPVDEEYIQHVGNVPKGKK